MQAESKAKASPPQAGGTAASPWLGYSRGPWNNVLAAFVKDCLQWLYVFCNWLVFLVEWQSTYGVWTASLLIALPPVCSRTSGNSVMLLSFQLVLHVFFISGFARKDVIPNKFKKREKYKEWAMSRVFSFLLSHSDGQKNGFLFTTKEICFILWDEAS